MPVQCRFEQIFGYGGISGWDFAAPSPYRPDVTGSVQGRRLGSGLGYFNSLAPEYSVTGTYRFYHIHIVRENVNKSAKSHVNFEIRDKINIYLKKIWHELPLTNTK